jgi:hypothetical protein
MRQNPVLLRLVASSLSGVLAVCVPAVPILAASDGWSRVIGLDRNTEVRVELADGQSYSGSLVAATSYLISVRSMGEDKRISREQVRRITRVWSQPSAPLVAAAVTGGVAAAGALLYGCTRENSSCGGGVLVAAVSVPVALAYWAIAASTSERTNVVYEADAAKRRYDTQADWETIRRTLPPSLQGARPGSR